MELENQSSLNLKIGEFYKIFDVSEFMAHTMARVIKIQALDTEKGKYVFSMKGKRKKYYLRVTESTLILPLAKSLKADSETGSFTGNALINLIGDPAEIKKVIEGNNLNPTLDKGIIVAIQRKEGSFYPENITETPVFIDEARENRSSHAAMDGILAKQSEG